MSNEIIMWAKIIQTKAPLILQEIKLWHEENGFYVEDDNKEDMVNNIHLHEIREFSEKFDE